jgi:hypothetical protein
MSIRNLFDGDAPSQVFSETPENIRKDGESLENITETWKNKNRFIPQVDFSNPENFARYGSAEQYYQDAITRIYEEYPYDGSSKEKQEFLNESTYIDLWLLDNKYPRRNGYINHGLMGGYIGTTGTTVAWALTNDNEYIHMVGGPHTASQGMIGKPLQETFDDSNIYDEDIYDDVGYTGKGTRESNLKCDPDNGVTVEFWLKKPTWAPAFGATDPIGESIFDLSGTNDGRFNVSITSGSGPVVRFNCLYRAQTLSNSYTPDVTTLISTGSWNHIAVSYANSGSVAEWKLYLNGNLVDTAAAASQPVEITGSLQANIGALVAHYPGESGTALADGKLTGSLDEFRYWKTQRTSEDIGRYWFTQVYGGTNTDIANTTLGVYYKFNEGVSGINSIDSSVLDYSGRVSNGSWTGYTTNSRTTDSAMVEANAAASEFKDPIIYPENPAVQTVLTEMLASGSYHDYNNTTSLYNGFPNWIIDGDNDSDGELKLLTQIMSSYFDTLHLQIEQINKIKNISYVSSSDKPIPFAGELLEGLGLVAPEIFVDSSVINQIFNRDEEKEFADSLFDTKNMIYKNIYNNIVDIYKSKGTSKSFKQLIRCYGVDENLIKINAYANNLVYNLNENYDFSSTKKKFIDFYKPDNFAGTIYQQTASGNPDSVSFISASGGTLETYTSFTYETEVIFPKKKIISNNVYYPTPFITSSIFGFHSADSTAPTDFTWPATDYDLQVYAIRPDTNSNIKDGHLMITSSFFGIEERSPIIKDLYDNKKWNLALRVSPEKIDADLVSGSTITNYLVELYALNTIVDVVQEERILTSSIAVDGDKLLTTPKRVYMGAHRQNFTGSLIQSSDLKFSSTRYWMSYLNNSVIKSHARDNDNFGVYSPYQNTYNFVTSIGNVEIPQMETLALYWSFDQITTTDVGGGVPTVPDAGFNIVDFSSGSAITRQRYDWLGNVLGSQHTGRGDLFYPNDTSIINMEFVPVAQQTTPEIVNSYDTVKVFNIEDDQLFTKQTRPSNFYFMVEKSMYRAITQQIINYFATILDFNNLIGNPVNRYRQEYKDLQKLRHLFFEKVQNEPDIERYIEYYKWIDSSLGKMIMELFPASVVKQDGIRTVVESHILERNKYWNKYPTVDLKQDDPESAARGINEMLYDWESGHHPVSDAQNESCFWWKEKAERDKAPLATGDAGVDADKEQILSVTLSALNRKLSTPLRLNIVRSNDIHGGLTSNNNNIRTNVKSAIQFGNSSGVIIRESQVKGLKDCNDVLDPLLKKKFSFEATNTADESGYATGEGDFLVPFVPISSSVTTGYNSKINTDFKPGFGVDNLHIDSYEDYEVPLQGPFTEKWVGGNQHRHVPLNQGTDTVIDRPEAWALEFQTGPTAMKFVHQPVNLPRAVFYRDLVAKRPLNIKNIKDNTTTGELGNYSQDYQIVQTCGRTENNSAFVKAGGFEALEVPSPFIAGLDDYAKLQRGRSAWVFVNRFSCPGDASTAGDSDGGPGLDIEAAEFSAYNDINYRNFAVRDPYRLLLASHVNQFGYYADTFNLGVGSSSVNSLNYSGTGSIYQVNRNPIKQMKESGSTTITTSVYDNFYVQHPIPRTDLQYAWITASAISYDTFGYLPYSGEGDLVTFSSASDYVSTLNTTTLPTIDPFFGFDKRILPYEIVAPIFTASYYIPTVYAQLNYNIYEPLEYLSSFTGYTPSDASVVSYGNDKLIPAFLSPFFPLFPVSMASILNATLLKRNGPYQHPSWKQTRGYENPLVKKWNSSNITAYNLEDDSFKLREDPPIISKYKPLRHILTTATPNLTSGPYTPSLTTIRINSSYGSEKTFFANRAISTDLNITNDNVTTSYERILSLYTNGALLNINNPIQGIDYFAYGEQVYPAAINCYSTRNRARVGYQNTFWRDSRLNRTTLGESKFGGGENSQGFVVSQSAWSIDAAEQFGTGLSTYIAESASIGAAGELQNDYTFAFRLFNQAVTGLQADLKPSPTYARKHTLGSIHSSLNHSGPASLRAVATSSNYLMANEITGNNWPSVSLFNSLGHLSIFGGNAKFEAHTLAGYVEDGSFVSSPSTPFYDKYELYNLNMRLKNKDMSLIPEFRMSDHIQKYISEGFNSSNPASFSIFGITGSNIQEVIYKIAHGVTGSYSVQVSDNIPQDSSEPDFYRIYSFSDFMEYFEVISDEHDQFTGLPKNLTLSCKALMKFIPYDGFYPVERTLEIAKEFKTSFLDESAIVPDDNYGGVADVDILKYRPILATMFAPGVMFNTIKSGVAVDYPIYTDDWTAIRIQNSGAAFSPPAPATDTDNSDYYLVGVGTGPGGGSAWDYRVPFEALLEPESFDDFNIKIYDMEPHPSASANTPANTGEFWTSIENTPKSSKNPYKLMINNFLGEVPRFFLKNESLSSISSVSEDNFTPLKAGSFYGMRIKMYRSTTGQRGLSSGLGFGSQIPYPQDLFFNTNNFETMTMYSRPSAFGPPIAGAPSVWKATPAVANTGPNDYVLADATRGNYPSHTPPYYNGEAWMDIIYEATADGVPTIDQIFNDATLRYWRIDKRNLVGGVFPIESWSSTGSGTGYPMHKDNVNGFAMQLSSSLNIFQKEFVPSDADPSTNVLRWTIQTKFETPMMNFGDTTERPLNFDVITTPTTGTGAEEPWEGYGGITTTPIGMWHQFGLIPEKDKGIFIEVADIDRAWLEIRADDADTTAFYNAGDVKSLAQNLGFIPKQNTGLPVRQTKNTKKLGQLSDSKTVYEAIVAIPFIERINLDKTSRKTKDKNIRNRLFFELKTDDSFPTFWEKHVPIIENRDPRTIFPWYPTGNSILEMADKVKNRYVFPPEFDFIRNLSTKPVAMYIFEFEHTFDKNDLSYIWQNIAPKFGTQFKESTATISHPLFESLASSLDKKELLDDLKDKVKWMVFKVKQRAETNYYDNLAESTKKTSELSAEDQLAFGYNWPYDYFSMVEFAKIDATVSYGDSGLPALEKTAPVSTTGLPPDFSTDVGQANASSAAQNKNSAAAVQAGVVANIDIQKRDIGPSSGFTPTIPPSEED